MKIALINPFPFDAAEGEKAINLYFDQPDKKMPPMGLLYLATILHNISSHQAFVFDQSRFQPNQWLFSKLQRLDPDVVGLSALADNSVAAMTIARWVRNNLPNAKIILGNQHANYCWELVLKYYPNLFDAFVLGEADLTLPALLDAWENGSDVNDIPGLVLCNYKQSGQGRKVTTTGPPRPLTKEQVNNFPFPDRTLAGREYVLEFAGLELTPGKFTAVLSSRGCPFKCLFCCGGAFSHRYLPRSPENVVSELAMLENLGYKYVLFADDNLCLDARRIEKICALIRKERLDIEWMGNSRVDGSVVNRRTLSTMVQSNCRGLYYGIESANQGVLNFLNKRITPQMSALAVDKTRQAGVEIIIGTFIIGAPGETLEQCQRTLRFALQLDIDFPQLNILNATPGSPLWDILVKEGRINPEAPSQDPQVKMFELGVQVPYLFKESVSCATLVNEINTTYRKFFLRPNYILKRLLRMGRSHLILKSVFRNLKNVRQWQNLTHMNNFRV